MTVNVVIAVVLAAIVMGMATAASIAQFHPPRSPDAVQFYVVGFILAMLIGIVLVGWQTIRSELAQEASRRIQENLIGRVDASNRDIRVRLDEINRSLLAIRGLPETSLKKRALQLSADILRFLLESNRNEPPLPRPETWVEDSNRLLRHSREMQDTFSERFGVRVRAIHDELAQQGLRDPQLDSLYQHPTNPIGMRIVGETIGALAERLP